MNRQSFAIREGKRLERSPNRYDHEILIVVTEMREVSIELVKYSYTRSIVEIVTA